MATEKTIKIKVDADGAIKETKKLTEEVKDVESEVKGVGDAAAGSKGGFQKMASGIGAVGLALKAAGIRLLISGLAMIKDSFMQNQRALDMFNKALLQFQYVVDILINRFIDFQINFRKAMADPIGYIRGEIQLLTTDADNAGKSILDLMKDGAQYAEIVNQLRKDVQLAEAEQRIIQLQYQKQAEIQRQIRDDINLSFDERIAANQRLKTILVNQIAEEKKLAQQRLDLVRIQLKNNKDKVELQVEEKNALAVLAELEERINSQRSEMLRNETALQNEKQAAIKETEDAEKKALEDKKKRVDEEIMTFAKKEAARNKDLADQELAARKEKKIADDLAHAKLQIAKDEAQMKRDIVANSLGAVASLIGEETKAGKALAIAQAYIHMYSAATNALAPKSLGGAGPIFGPIAAAGAIAAGLANIKSIINTDLPGVDDDSGDVGGGTAEVPGFVGDLIPNMEAVDQPELGGATPIQAFVVENDISNAQALQEELEIQSTL